MFFQGNNGKEFIMHFNEFNMKQGALPNGLLITKITLHLQ